MSVPSITSITPSSGPTGGGVLVEIDGADFQVPVPPIPLGLTTPLTPTVRVLVGDRAARDVRVFSADRLTCIVPAGDPGAADVVMQRTSTSPAPRSTASWWSHRRRSSTSGIR